ncbi:DUF1064 domain-containing protein [Lentilactobacillus kefiri]|uniref:DUF1064 domain-containing protein n=1 Tax=Lentilactobacillus kefiri TaxID=33962 RepID=UPI0024691D23|nr:DUF1064 domain-containing protein [Lentilactobacillus kefiri]MDH5108486.1 DUF1064 domain-containing protein [Lentilactobacillus kefiri]
MSKPVKERSSPRAKFNNSKQEIDGYKFDSKVEAAYYLHLKNLKLDFKIHEKFEIQPAFYLDNPHKRESACTYKPDFSIYEDGELISVVDVKGNRATLTEASRLRMKIFMSKYKVPVVIATLDYRTGIFQERVK